MEKLKRISKILFIILLFVLIILNLGTITSIGADISEALQIQGYSDEYLEWLSLSEEERSNTIQPPMYNIQYNMRTTISIFNTLTRESLASSLSRYNLGEYINIEVKNQGSTNSCWTFVATTVLETNLALIRGEYYDYSERHMEYATSYTFIDGINSLGYKREVGEGGNEYMAYSYYISGSGPVSEEEVPFEDNEDQQYLSYIGNVAVEQEVEETIYFPNITSEIKQNQDISDFRSSVKEHIIKYGAVTARIYISGNSQYYNSQTGAYYYNGTSITNHQVTIVGWDDDYEVSNFSSSNQPSGKGAYIVLNSYGSNWGDEGYMYVSYEDAWIDYVITGVISAGDIDHDNIYQNDILGANTAIGFGTNVGFAATILNKPTSKAEALTEIGVDILEEASCDIYINMSGELDLNNLILIASTSTLKTGYHTIELNIPIQLTKGDFTIIVKYTASNSNAQSPVSVAINQSYWDVDTYEEGESFILYNGTWYDLATDLTATGVMKATIKAFTIDTLGSITLNKESVTLYKGDQEVLEATISPESIQNETLKWTSSNEDIVTVTGEGKIIAISRGTATITVSNEEGTISAICGITVLDPSVTIEDIAPSSKILYTSDTEALTISVTLLDIDNIEIYILKNETYVTSSFNISSEYTNENTVIITITAKEAIESGTYTIYIAGQNIETKTVQFQVLTSENEGSNTDDDDTNTNNTNTNGTNTNGTSTNNTTNTATSTNITTTSSTSSTDTSNSTLSSTTLPQTGTGENTIIKVMIGVFATLGCVSAYKYYIIK